MNRNDTARQRRSRAPKPKRLSRLYPPSDMAPEAWQVTLRRQYGREQKFKLENLGAEPVFSEFRVTNPITGGRYRVAIRGTGLGDNYCSCPDYGTNELGTCKHIEFALAAVERKRGGRAALKRGYQPPFSEIYLRYGLQRSVHFRPGITCPLPLLAAAQKLFDEATGWRLAPERFSRLDGFLARTTDEHELRVYDDALEFIAHARDAERRKELIDTVFLNGARSRSLRQLVKLPLHPYQVEGALFAARAGRCLIADEMGLGKTAQALAAAEILTRHLDVERVLVICPTSLKHQWELELLRFTGRVGRVIGGGRARRQQQYADSGAWKIAAYDTVARDLDLVTAWSPDLVIIDEAQRIKNWNTIAARALKRIDTPYAFVLTGTPLENKLEELVSIVQFVDRYRLGPTWRLLHEHQLRDDHGRVIGYRRLDDIAHTLAPIMIRRRKKEVLSQLPERVDHNRFVPMTAEQLRFHEENREIVARIVARWRKTRFLSEADQRRLTCALQNMRMSCNSTYLLDHETDYGVKTGELVALLEDLFEEPDAKAVVFSQWFGTHELIARRLAARRWGHVVFHGGVPSDQRGSLVQRFREDPQCRVFLSTDAGGLGLNLQHAATVVNMDLPWNPAVLEQRIGRVYRLGQRRGVQVVNLIARGTIEEGMLSLLGFKKSLFAGVLDGGNADVFLHGTRLSLFMEGVEKATRATGRVQSQEPPLQEEIATAVETADTQASASAAELAAPAGGREAGAAAADPWQTLLDAGLKFIVHLSQAGAESARGSGEATADHSWLETDASTGRSYLRLPLPAPEALRKLTSTLESLLSGLPRS